MNLDEEVNEEDKVFQGGVLNEHSAGEEDDLDDEMLEDNESDC